MATGPRYAVKFRRRREGKTDYRKRLALLKSGKTRLVVRPTGKQVIAQLIEYHEKGDRIIAAAQSKELTAMGWKGAVSNTTAAYLTGYLVAVKSQGKVKEAVLDIGLQTAVPGGLVFAAMKGAIDAGVHIPAGKDIVPQEDRIKGKHLKHDAGHHFDTVLKAVIAYKPGPKKDRSKFRAAAAKAKDKAPAHAAAPAATHPAHAPAHKPHAAAPATHPAAAPKTGEEERAKRRSALEDLLGKRKEEGK